MPLKVAFATQDHVGNISTAADTAVHKLNALCGEEEELNLHTSCGVCSNYANFVLDCKI